MLDKDNSAGLQTYVSSKWHVILQQQKRVAGFSSANSFKQQGAREDRSACKLQGRLYELPLSLLSRGASSLLRLLLFYYLRAVALFISFSNSFIGNNCKST